MEIEDFPALEFDGLSEADIRAEVIDPVVRKLGYRSNSEHNVVREITLRYDRQSLGRKKPKSDPILIGRPDYVLEVRGVGRWVIEAKPPDYPIQIDDIEQAHSYSVHPEIQATYFVICNGREFQIYQTMKGPNAEPLVHLPYHQLKEKFPIVENILAPEAIVRDVAGRSVDIGVPLAPGLRSSVRIIGGTVEISEVSASIPLDPQMTGYLKSLTAPILGDVCERGPEGHILAIVRVAPIYSPIQEMAKRYGFDTIEFKTSDEYISDLIEKKTIMEGTNIINIEPNSSIYNPITRENQITTFPIRISMLSEVIGFVDGKLFTGDFFNRSAVEAPIDEFNVLSFEFSTAGNFKAELDISRN